MQEYHFEIIHRPGKRHTNADALSRRPCNRCQRPEMQCSGQESQHQKQLTQVAVTSFTTGDHGREQTAIDLELRTSQLHDNVVGPVLQAKETNCRLSKDSLKQHCREVTQLEQQWDQLVLQHGVLYRRFESPSRNQLYLQLVVSKDQQNKILQEIHGGRMGGHLGEERTFKKLQEQFYWPGYSQSVKEWCHNCPHCGARKGSIQKHRGPLQTVGSGYPMQMVATDIVGPLPESTNGDKYILVASDYFTRWAEAYAIPNQEATTVATKLIDNMFCRFGIPEQLHSDMGAQFESTLLKEVSKLLDINKTHTTPYHPQEDGLVERLNRTMLAILATMVDEHGEDWENYLSKICFAYNTCEHTSTGFAPFYLMFGRQAKIPLDIVYGSSNTAVVTPSQYASKLRHSLEESYQLTHKHSLGAACRQKAHYDSKVHGKPFKVGDLVWLCTPVRGRKKSKKLHCPWTGPFKVVKQISALVYRIQNIESRKHQIVHFERLKSYSRNMRPRSKETQHEPMQSLVEEDVNSTPPGTVLQLVEDNDEEDATDAPSMVNNVDPCLPERENTNKSPRQYPQRKNRNKPIRYTDGLS